MNDEEIVGKRLKELALRAYDNGYYTYTNFLGIAEISMLKKLFMTDEALKGMPYILYGGGEGCERCIAAFGSKELFGYDCEFPLSCIKIKPRMQKYADRLTHRDILGAVLNLGTKRETIGDIYINDNEGYMFCLDTVKQYIIDSLIKVKHTFVSCEQTEQVCDMNINRTAVSLQVSSLRIDSIIAKAYRLSRNEAQLLIRAGRVYINGILCESMGRTPKEGEVITVRGYGRMEYEKTVKETKKGNLIVNAVIWK